jgi:mannose-6-phosphate isomerase-like protein (cupin superfamily)
MEDIPDLYTLLPLSNYHVNRKPQQLEQKVPPTINMLSFLRAPHPPKTHQATQDITRYENGTSSVQYHGPGSKYLMTHTIPPTHPVTGPSIVQPPFHLHIHQTEHFHVAKGRAHLYFGLARAPAKTLDASSGGSTSSTSTATLGPRRYHRFENASATEDLVIDIQLDPEDVENEMRFFRNFFGYLDDCKRAGQAPSVFQLFVFLHSADTPLAVPLPGFPGAEMLGVYLSWVLMVAVAWVGRYVLGYRESYPEYYDGKKRA